MKFVPLPLLGAYLIETAPIVDDRGFFARIICRETYVKHGLSTELVQASMSYNKQCGTLRGMHWQAEPYGEIKLVRVTKGSIFDVIVDLRKKSPTYLQHCSVILNATEPTCLYIPEGFAHGFQTLENETEVYYHMNQEFQASAARGFLWKDPQFAILWPLGNPILSPKDLSAPLFSADLLN
jgi:dTDP-4-dehydrorhamnose 3,5-epimerase